MVLVLAMLGRSVFGTIAVANGQQRRLFSADRLLKLNDLSHIEGSVKTVSLALYFSLCVFLSLVLFRKEDGVVEWAQVEAR